MGGGIPFLVIVSLKSCDLRAHQRVVEAALVHEFLMSANFYDPAVPHYADLIGLHDSAESVSDNHCGTVSHQLRE